MSASAQELLAQARALMVRRAGAGAGDGSRMFAGAWPRAVALLGRQALEQGLDDFWGAIKPRVSDASRHAQLLCLGTYLPNEAVVSGIRHAWHGLSRACHHQAYELPPTADELGHWLEAVERLAAYDPLG